MRTQISKRCIPAGVALRMSLVVNCLVMLGVGCGSPDTPAAEVSPHAGVGVESTEAAQHPVTVDDENMAEVGIDRDLNAAYRCGNPETLCLGKCQLSTGVFSLGSIVAKGHCADAVADACSRHRWGKVTLACWGHQ